MLHMVFEPQKLEDWKVVCDWVVSAKLNGM
jgi:hypothetical protein